MRAALRPFSFGKGRTLSIIFAIIGYSVTVHGGFSFLNL